ncbi:transglutaminase domain-containing protein [Pelagicoccus sp. SDUM812003]|uniref:transglutaminase domain-containing protein n=1 Tax=Pelagicoccus sp. SDUM812003 TaxID=3041267 RepID=UPI00280FED58|nr:transglutaminase domain-containing protein [Pelagicoccus sp. SDUM812003]MDQ8202486.1 transglutaminase domain-containing protein [Pelagicoccus sp. SDUM812003]
MKRILNRPTPLSNAELSSWLILSSATISFAIISSNAVLAFSTAILFSFLKALSYSRSKARATASAYARWGFIVGLYLFFLIPLWPYSLYEYHWIPWAIIVSTSTLAASLSARLGAGRAITIFVVIATLLFFRNLIISYEFIPPYREILELAPFIAFIEILRSRRKATSDQAEAIEFPFALLLAIFASFQIESAPLATLLGALPILGFAIESHQRSKGLHGENYSSLHESPESTPSPSYGSFLRSSIPFAALAVLFGALLFMVLLKTPFWGDLARNAPFHVRQMAQSARELSHSGDLDTRFIEERFPSFGSQNQAPSSTREDLQQTVARTEPARAKSSQVDQPAPASGSAEGSGIRFKVPQVDSPLASGARYRNDDINSLITISPSRPSETSEYKTDVPQEKAGLHTTLESPGSYDTPPSRGQDESRPSVIDQVVDAIRSTPSSPASASNDDTWAGTESAQPFYEGRSMDLQHSNTQQITSSAPLLTATIDSARTLPQRLYLRLDFLDTITSNGLSQRNDLSNTETTASQSGAFVRMNAFQTSRDASASLTLTAVPQRLSSLPLPESFQSARIIDHDVLRANPERRTIAAPRSDQPISYKVRGADFTVTSQERLPCQLSEQQQAAFTELPIAARDRAFLKRLSKRLANGDASRQIFARNAARYFSQTHPYAYETDIRPGSGHIVVRWLQSESPGLCENYAAAFVMLARSRGIPARVVTGFASSEYEPDKRRYVFRQLNAHAWVEYLDESNRWIRFDPTPPVFEAQLNRDAQGDQVENRQTLAQLETAESLHRDELSKAPATSEDAAAPRLNESPEPSLSSEQSSELDQLSQLASIKEGMSQAKPSTTSPVASTNPVAPEEPQETRPEAVTQSSQDPQERASGSDSGRDPAPVSLPNSQRTEATIEQRPAPVEPSLAHEPAKQPGRLRPSHAWILLLLGLALIHPFITFLRNVKNKAPQSAELRLRARAGRLLAQTESLARNQTSDSASIETLRRQLASQRYGKTVDAEFVQQLANQVLQFKRTYLKTTSTQLSASDDANRSQSS